MTEFMFLSKIQDTRVDCWSLLTDIRVRNYLDIAEAAYQNRGGIKHQREALKTTSARRIRSRLVEDLQRGAVIPPIVIGIVVNEDDRASITHFTEGFELKSLLEKYSRDLSIIDGMQRTTALKDALKVDEKVAEHLVRIEVWVATNTESLIYRMLVLNTGQAPWNLRQQLEVVYAPLTKNIAEKVRFSRLLTGTDRRWRGGEFKSDSLIEAYIAFGLRRTEIDTQESLADEFSRLDVAEALTAKKYDHYFYTVVQMLVDLDIALSRYNEIVDPVSYLPEDGDDGLEGSPKTKKLVRGRNIFDTQAGRVGFVVACAVAIMGRVGMDRDETYSEERSLEMIKGCAELVSRLNKMNDLELQKFVALDILSEKLSKRSTSAVGRWERSFFENSFKVLIEEKFKVPSMEACWRA